MIWKPCSSLESNVCLSVFVGWGNTKAKFLFNAYIDIITNLLNVWSETPLAAFTLNAVKKGLGHVNFYNVTEADSKPVILSRSPRILLCQHAVNTHSPGCNSSRAPGFSWALSCSNSFAWPIQSANQIIWSVCCKSNFITSHLIKIQLLVCAFFHVQQASRKHSVNGSI